MTTIGRRWTGILSGLCMIVLILDSKTALTGAKDGLMLCLNAVIPALFPFIIISAIFNSNIIGRKIKFLRPLCKMCGIPAGCESVLLLGLIGGYPVGAQTVYDAYRGNCIDAPTAKRILGFCNNAGPSFIFGILSTQFSTKGLVWIIWLIHIISALFVGAVLPNKQDTVSSLSNVTAITLSKAMENALKVLASICGWVILFRIIISFFNCWFSWLLPVPWQVAIAGILELTNGCCTLSTLPSESLQFVICCCLLSFGGFCVFLQTLSVTKELRGGLHFYGKILQTTVSFILACILQPLLFSGDNRVPLPYLCVGILCFILFLYFLHRKKVVAL